MDVRRLGVLVEVLCLRLTTIQVGRLFGAKLVFG